MAAPTSPALLERAASINSKPFARIPDFPELQARENVLLLDSHAISLLRDAPEDKLLLLRDRLEQNNPHLPEDEIPPILALHPIMNKARVVKRYEILARGRTLNVLPEQWFKELSQEGRISFTLRGAKLSQHLWAHDMDAHFNLQSGDFEAISQEINIETTRWELAEYGMKDGRLLDYAVDPPQPIFMERVDDHVSPAWKDATLDDCLSVDENGKSKFRGGDEVVELIRHQTDEIRSSAADGEADAVHKTFDTLKIDHSIAYRAFRSENEADDEVHRRELERVVSEVWQIDPEIIFVVEFSVADDEWGKVPSLKAGWDAASDRVLVQGGALAPYAIRVTDGWTDESAKMADAKLTEQRAAIDGAAPTATAANGSANGPAAAAEEEEGTGGKSPTKRRRTEGGAGEGASK